MRDHKGDVGNNSNLGDRNKADNKIRNKVYSLLQLQDQYQIQYQDPTNSRHGDNRLVWATLS